MCITHTRITSRFVLKFGLKYNIKTFFLGGGGGGGEVYVYTNTETVYAMP